jgi:hypothetical protein
MQPKKISTKKQIKDIEKYQLKFVQHQEYLNECDLDLYTEKDTEFYNFLNDQDNLSFNDDIYELNNKFIWALVNTEGIVRNTDTTCKNILEFYILTKSLGNGRYYATDSIYNKNKIISFDHDNLLKKINLTNSKGNKINTIRELDKNIKDISKIKEGTELYTNSNIFIAFTFLNEDKINYLITFKEFMTIINNKFIEISNKANNSYDNVNQKFMKYIENNFDNELILTKEERNLILIGSVYTHIKNMLLEVFNKNTVNYLLKIPTIESNIIPQDKVNIQQEKVNILQDKVNILQDKVNILQDFEESDNKQINIWSDLNNKISKYFIKTMEIVTDKNNANQLKIIKKYTYIENIKDELKTLINELDDNLISQKYKHVLVDNLLNKSLEELTIPEEKTINNQIKENIDKIINIATKLFNEMKTKIINDLEQNITTSEEQNITTIDKKDIKQSEENSINYLDFIESVIDEINKYNIELIKNINSELKTRENFYSLDEIKKLEEDTVIKIKEIIKKIIQTKKNKHYIKMLELLKDNEKISVVFKLINSLFEHNILFNNIQTEVSKELYDIINKIDNGEIFYDEEINKSINSISNKIIDPILDVFYENNEPINYFNKFYNNIPIIKKIDDLERKLIEKSKIIDQNNISESKKQKKYSDRIKKSKDEDRITIKRTKGSKAYDRENPYNY